MPLPRTHNRVGNEVKVGDIALLLTKRGQCLVLNTRPWLSLTVERTLGLQQSRQKESKGGEESRDFEPRRNQYGFYVGIQKR